MEWAVRLFFKLVLLVVAVAIVFSFVRQLFSPVERPVVLAGPGGGRLPVPLPRGNLPAARRVATANPAPPPPPPPPPVRDSHDGSTVDITPAAVPPVDTSKPILEAIHDQILYRFVEATAQGNRLTIRLQALNKGTDRMIEIGSLPWSKTLFYNERSEAYLPQEVRIANTRANSGKTRAMLVAGVPAEILLVYNDLPMTAGNLAFRQVALMQLDVALFSTDQAYRNFFAFPIAISRPTFRLITITDGSGGFGVSR
jgi:hypothetical protein